MEGKETDREENGVFVDIEYKFSSFILKMYNCVCKFGLIVSSENVVVSLGSNWSC